MIKYFPNDESAVLTYMNLLDRVVKSSRSYFSQIFSGVMDNVTYPFMARKFLKYSEQYYFRCIAKSHSQ